MKTNNFSRRGVLPIKVAAFLAVLLIAIGIAVYARIVKNTSTPAPQEQSAPTGAPAETPLPTTSPSQSTKPKPASDAKIPPTTSDSPTLPRQSASRSGGCGASKELFGMSPVSTEKISAVIPLGNFEPHSHIAPTTQIYLRYLHNGSIPALTTIYSPADMTVTQITLFDNNSSPHPFNSYRLDFAVCDSVKGYFILVQNLSDKLAAAFHEPYDYTQTSDVGLGKPDHTYRKNVSVALKAGEIIGNAGGKANDPDALDFGLSDFRTPASNVANPSRWIDQDLHYVCPLDYLPAADKRALYSKLDDFDGNLRTINEPKCGEVYQDVPGTAQGLWIAKSSTNPTIFDIPNLLTLGHSSFDHTRGVFAMGNTLQQLGFDNNSVYGFAPGSAGRVNVDFSKVAPDGNIYCYETANENDPRNQGMAALIQLLDAKTLRLGAQSDGTCGIGPWQFSKYLDFVR